MSTSPRPRPVRVALSNDYELVLLGLAQLLSQHPTQVQVVEMTTTPVMAHEPDVILYDTFGRLPEDDVKLRQMIEKNQAQVVVYSWEAYPEDAALRLGAAGYLHKGMTGSELVAAVVAIHDGVPVQDVEPAGEAVPSWPGQHVGLSQRESEVLTFVVRGLTNEEIARRSYLSINTVKTYVRGAYRKIGVSSRSQAVAWGYRNGFRSSDDTAV